MPKIMDFDPRLPETKVYTGGTARSVDQLTADEDNSKLMAHRSLIVSANPWSFCMAVERDLARRHAADQVDVLNLFKLCSRSSPHWRLRDKVIESVNRKIDRLVLPVITGHQLTLDVSIIDDDLPRLPHNYDELRSYERYGAKIGLAVLSSVASLTTIEHAVSLNEYGRALKSAWRSAHRSARIGQVVRTLGYDKVFIFNGRHCYSRPFCDIMEVEAEVIRYEQGSAGNRYISASTPIHKPETTTNLIHSHAFDRIAAQHFFEERLARSPRTEVQLFTDQQRPGLVPQDMEPGSAVSFFTSSADEMCAIVGSPALGEFGSQYAVALALADICNARGYQLFVRLHPHLRFKNRAWEREWDFDELKRRGATIIAPGDPIDSYEIVRSSKLVITAGSTIGVEATYLGVPNAVVGRTVSGCLGACSVANSRQELAKFVGSPSLPPHARERALWFGSYHNTAGTLLPELDVGIHPNLAQIDGQVVDPIRHFVQKLRFFFGSKPPNPQRVDIKSGLQAGRVVLAPGTDYSSAIKRQRYAR